jgi:hypothetical protein
MPIAMVCASALARYHAANGIHQLYCPILIATQVSFCALVNCARIIDVRQMSAFLRTRRLDWVPRNGRYRLGFRMPAR